MFKNIMEDYEIKLIFASRKRHYIGNIKPKPSVRNER